MLYPKEATKSVFLLLCVREVSPESRVSGPRSMSFEERRGFWGSSGEALEQGVEAAHGSHSTGDRQRCQPGTQTPAP